MRALIILPLWKGFLDVRNILDYQEPYVKTVLKLQTSEAITYSKF